MGNRSVARWSRHPCAAVHGVLLSGWFASRYLLPVRAGLVRGIPSGSVSVSNSLVGRCAGAALATANGHRRVPEGNPQVSVFRRRGLALGAS